MHYPVDVKRLENARKRGLPFFYTACDSAEPLAEITTDRTRVKCPGCHANLPAEAVSSITTSAPFEEIPAQSEDVDFDFNDLDADLDDFDGVEHEEAPASDEQTESAAAEPAAEAPVSPLGNLAPMLEMVLAGFDVQYPHLDEWTIEPDEQTLIGSHGIDLRTLLEDDERQFLTKLIGLSRMIDIEPLAVRVLAILHRALDRLAETQHDLDELLEADTSPPPNEASE